MNNTYRISADSSVRDLGRTRYRRPEGGSTAMVPILQNGFNALEISQDHAPSEQEIDDAAVSLRCPKSLPHWRVKRILIKRGLLDAVLAYINAIVDVDLKSTTLCAWEGGADVARHGPTVLGAKVALGLTDRQVDDLYLEGAKLEA